LGLGLDAAGPEADNRNDLPLIFAVLLFCYLFSQFFRSFLAVVSAELTRDMGFGPGELGALASAWFYTFAAAQFLVGWMLDTIGPRRTIGGLLLAAVAGAFLFAASQSFPVSIFAMGMIGLGCAPLLMGSLYIFGRSYPAARFALLAGLLIGLGNIGNLVSATPLAAAIAAFGWRWSMAAVGLAALVAACLALLLLRDPPPATGRPPGGSTGFLVDLKAVLAIRALWLSFPLHLVGYAMIATERGLWAGPYLQHVHGLGAIDRGNVLLAMSIGMALGAMACGPVDRLFKGPKIPAIIGNAVTALVLAALVIVPAGQMMTAAMLLTAFGFFGLTYSLLLGHGRPFFPDHLLGRGVTLLNFFAIGGAGLVQSITAAFIERQLAAGVPHAEAFAAMHLGMAIVLAAATALFLLVKPAPERR
jgi:sugar phosphate permease